MAPSTASWFEQAAWGVLAAGLVLVFSTSLDIQFTLPKLLVLRVMAPVLVGMWVWRFARNGVRLLPRSVAAAAMLLSAWWMLTTFTAVHPPTALDGAYGRFNGLWTHLLYLTLFVLAGTSCLTLKEIESRLQLLVSVLTISAVYCLLQYVGWDPLFGGQARPGSTIGNPVTLAGCLAVGMPFAAVFAARARRRPYRALWMAAGGTLFLAALSTGSRGPLVGILASLSILGLSAADALGVRRLTIAIVALALAAVSLLVVVRARTGRVPTSFGALVSDAASRDRGNAIRAGLRVAREYPIRGVGLENFSVVYPRFRTPEADSATPDELPTMVHSGYVQAAATTGVPGLLLYVGLVASVLALLARRARNAADAGHRLLLSGCLAALAGYLVSDLTGWLEVSLTSLFWILLGLALSAARAAEPASVTLPRTRRIAVGLATAWALLVALLAVRLTTVAQANQMYRDVTHGSGMVDWSVERAAVERGLDMVGTDPHYVDAAGIRYAVRFGATGEQNLYDRAAQLFDLAHRLDPFSESYVLHRIDLETAALQKRAGAPGRGALDAAAIVEAGDWHNGRAYAALARFGLARQVYPGALDAIGRAKALRPWSIEYVVLEGDIYHAIHELPRSIADYRAAVAGSPPGSAPWVNAVRRLTVNLLEAGEGQEAVVQARDLDARAPDDISRQLLSVAQAEASKPR